MAARSPGSGVGMPAKVDAATLIAMVGATQGNGAGGSNLPGLRGGGLGLGGLGMNAAIPPLQLALQQQLLQNQLALLASQSGGSAPLGGGLNGFNLQPNITIGTSSGTGALPTAIFPNLPTQPAAPQVSLGAIASLQQHLQQLQAAYQQQVLGATGTAQAQQLATLQAALTNHNLTAALARANGHSSLSDEAQGQRLFSGSGTPPAAAAQEATTPPAEDTKHQALKQLLAQSIDAIARSNAALHKRQKGSRDSATSSNANSETSGPTSAPVAAAAQPSTPKAARQTPAHGAAKTPNRGLNPAAPAFNPVAEREGASTPVKNEPKDSSLCHFYMRGMCAHGGDCRFSHEFPVVGMNGANINREAQLRAAVWPSGRAAAPQKQRLDATPPSRHRSETRAEPTGRREGAKDPSAIPDTSSFYVPSQRLEHEYAVRPCDDYNAGGCPDESWPHKLTHFYKESPGEHETDTSCIYPNPRTHFRTCQVHHKRVWRWEPTTESWIQASPASPQLPPEGKITVMTYNVLFDHYMKGQIHSRKRYQALLEVLREAQFDVVCLQEVQSAFLTELLEEEWVRVGYWSTAEPNCASLQFAGVVVLSRFPLSGVSIHDLPQTCGNISPSVVGRISLADGFEVDLFSAHLSQSDVDIRACQLANLLRKTQASDFALLLGDFNVHALEPGNDYYDAWVESQPPVDEDGHTLSLTQNPMASLMAEHDIRAGEQTQLEEVSGRFDHIFIKANPLIANTRRLNVIQGTAVVGGRDTCRHYLSRRFMRLCRYLGRDPDEVAAEGGIADQVLDPAPSQDNTNITPPAAPETYGPAASQRQNHENLLRKTVAALKGLPDYLCPSDHYYLKVQIEAVVR